MTAVREVMTANPVTVDCDVTVSAAARRMRDEEIGDVIVTEGGQVRGIVTDHDITVRAVAAEADPRAMTIGEVMTSELVTVAPDDDLKAAEGLMRVHAVKHLPVLDGDRLVGILTLDDVSVEEAPDSLHAVIAVEEQRRG